MLEIVCQPGTINRQKYATSYGLHITIKGYPQCVKQRRMLVYGEGGAELALEYMVSHLQMQHGQ